MQPVAVDFARMPWIGPDSAARAIWSDGWPAAWVAELAAHLTMLHGLFPHGVLPDAWVSFLGAAWSLSTEWQFYALVALIGARLGRGELGRWRLVLLLLGLALAAVAWQQMAPPGWLVQPRLPAEQGGVFCAWRGQRGADRGPAPMAAVPGSSWAWRWCWCCACGRTIRSRCWRRSAWVRLPGGASRAGAVGRLVVRPARARRAAAQSAAAPAGRDLVLAVPGERADPETAWRSCWRRWRAAGRRCSPCCGCRARC